MVREWRGVLIGQAILTCMILAYVQIVFGWWVYCAACVMAFGNSLAIFGVGKAVGRRFAERTIGWWLALNDLLIAYFTFALFIRTLD